MAKEKKRLESVRNVAAGLGRNIADIGRTFAEGSWSTRISFLIMGFGQLVHRQVLRGVLFLATEILFIYFMVTFGAQYVIKLPTLGTVATHTDKTGVVPVTVYGDNSFLILLYGILCGDCICLSVAGEYPSEQADPGASEGRKAPSGLHAGSEVPV